MRPVWLASSNQPVTSPPVRDSSGSHHQMTRMTGQAATTLSEALHEAALAADKRAIDIPNR